MKAQIKTTKSNTNLLIEMLKSNPSTLEPKLGGIVAIHLKIEKKNTKNHHIRLVVKMAFKESRSRGIWLET